MHRVSQNLLKSVEGSTEEARDSSQNKLVEARTRADLLQLRSERDSSRKDAMVAERAVALLTSEVTGLKKDRTKLQHDKLRLEREVRSARSFASGLSTKLLGAGNQGDLEYYKGKLRELEAHLQGMEASMAEKNKELVELRRCRDRNWSQNRLEAWKAKATVEGAVGPNPKKARHMY